MRLFAVLPLETVGQASSLETQAEFLCWNFDTNFFFFGKLIFALAAFRLEGERSVFTENLI